MRHNEPKTSNRIYTKEIGWMIFLAVSFLLCLLITITKFERQNEQDVINQARIVLKPELEVLTEGVNSWKTTDDNATTTDETVSKKPLGDYLGEVEHEYVIFDFSGEVIAGTTTEYQVGDSCNLVTELQTDHAYLTRNTKQIKICFPIMQEGKAGYFVLFFIPEHELKRPEIIQMVIIFWPMIVWGIVTLLFGIVYLNMLIRKWYRPMEQMMESSEAIIAGDYSRQITQKRTYDKPNDPISKLVYQFERMRDELKYKAAREDELCNSQKELMSCMSHDLRTPITTILAHAEAMRDGIIRDEEKKKEYIDTIIRKSEVMNRMIADLLDHSNAQVNQMAITRKEQYLGSVIDQIALELTAYCSQNGCRFTYENQCGEMLVEMDSGRITQVIYNLVENSCKYRDYNRKDCKVTLSLVRAEEERRVYITVSDNGPGIAMSDIPYVFDRFYRAEKSRSTQIPGAGLGLNICKYIIEKHHGEITLESRKNEGTSVTFYLPY